MPAVGVALVCEIQPNKRGECKLSYKIRTIFLSSLLSCLPAFAAPIVSSSVSCSVVSGGATVSSLTGTTGVNCTGPGLAFSQASATYDSFGIRLVSSVEGISSNHPTIPFTVSNAAASIDWENQLVITGGTGAAVFTPSFSLTQGPPVSCSFSVNGGPSGGCGLGSFAFTFGTPFTARIVASTSFGSFSPTSVQLIVGVNNGSSVIQNGNPVSGFTVSEVSAAPVPEPASTALSSLGLAATAWLMRRRRRAA